MAKKEIIGFMPSFNLYSQGYPFLEALYSSMKVCSKVYVSDGSTDETSDVLRRLANNPRIVLIKKRWNFTSKNTRKGEIIGEVSHDLLKIVKKEEGVDNGKWLFYFQANEIIHENSYDRIRHAMYGRSDGSLFDYQNLSNQFVRDDSFRLRIVKSMNNVDVLGDGTHLIIKNISPIKLLSAAGYYLLKYHTFYDNLFSNLHGYNFIWTPSPIFRYGAIFKDTVLNKIEMHLRMWASIKGRNEELMDKVLKIINLRNQVFWQKYSMITGGTQIKLLVKMHPKLMRNQIIRNTYKIRENLIYSILKNTSIS